MLTLLNILRWKLSLTLWKGIIVMLCIMTLIYFRERHINSQSKSVVSSLIVMPTSSYTVQKDGKSVTHEVVQGKVYSEKDFQVFADSLKNTNSHLTGKIITVTKTVTILQHDSIPVEYTIDTGQHEFEMVYDDSDIHIDCKGSTIQKDGVLHFYIRGDTSTYITTVKKHLFRSDVYSTDVSHTNKLFFTSMGETLELKPPKSIIVFGPCLGYGLDMKTMKCQPFLGISATLNIFSLKQKD